MRAAEIAAMTLIGLGVALALVHLVVTSFHILRGDAPSERPELIPWGYLGCGLVLAVIGFYVSRGLTAGQWGAIQDAVNVVMVLAVAAGGYGAAHQWLEKRADGAGPRWTIPLVLATLAGATLGMASPALL